MFVSALLLIAVFFFQDECLCIKVGATIAAKPFLSLPELQRTRQTCRLSHGCFGAGPLPPAAFDERVGESGKQAGFLGGTLQPPPHARGDDSNSSAVFLQRADAGSVQLAAARPREDAGASEGPQDGYFGGTTQDLIGDDFASEVRLPPVEVAVDRAKVGVSGSRPRNYKEGSAYFHVPAPLDDDWDVDPDQLEEQASTYASTAYCSPATQTASPLSTDHAKLSPTHDDRYSFGLATLLPEPTAQPDTTEGSPVFGSAAAATPSREVDTSAGMSKNGRRITVPASDQSSFFEAVISAEQAHSTSTGRRLPLQPSAQFQPFQFRPDSRKESIVAPSVRHAKEKLSGTMKGEAAFAMQKASSPSGREPGNRLQGAVERRGTSAGDASVGTAFFTRPDHAESSPIQELRATRPPKSMDPCARLLRDRILEPGENDDRVVAPHDDAAGAGASCRKMEQQKYPLCALLFDLLEPVGINPRSAAFSAPRAGKIEEAESCAGIFRGGCAVDGNLSEGTNLQRTSSSSSSSGASTAASSSAQQPGGSESRSGFTSQAGNVVAASTTRTPAVPCYEWMLQQAGTHGLLAQEARKSDARKARARETRVTDLRSCLAPPPAKLVRATCCPIEQARFLSALYRPFNEVLPIYSGSGRAQQPSGAAGRAAVLVPTDHNSGASKAEETSLGETPVESLSSSTSAIATFLKVLLLSDKVSRILALEEDGDDSGPPASRPPSTSQARCLRGSTDNKVWKTFPRLLRKNHGPGQHKGRQGRKVKKFLVYFFSETQKAPGKANQTASSRGGGGDTTAPYAVAPLLDQLAGPLGQIAHHMLGGDEVGRPTASSSTSGPPCSGAGPVDELGFGLYFEQDIGCAPAGKATGMAAEKDDISSRSCCKAGSAGASDVAVFLHDEAGHVVHAGENKEIKSGDDQEQSPCVRAVLCNVRAYQVPVMLPLLEQLRRAAAFPDQVERELQTECSLATVEESVLLHLSRMLHCSPES
ncbi:unnamed protein product [Amoebophrya sp. A120]|nr:unnamed protein product [Amoebophrya sp. A120]|eukprot:GSA120T00006038001.1